jgi:urease accessory protein
MAKRPTSTRTAEDVPQTGRPGTALLRLFHLVSPALPVGAYAYSQGLEYAVQAGWLCSEADVLAWLQGLSRHAIGTLDLPLLLRLQRAWRANDSAAVARWNAELVAARESAELRAEERHLGSALTRVLAELGLTEALPYGHTASVPGGFATLFALAAARWNIAEADTLAGYLWTWSENQVLCAVKLVPLGQSAGQRLLHRLIEDMPAIVEQAVRIEDHAIGVGAISQTLAAALHETQYSRLFRS